MHIGNAYSYVYGNHHQNLNPLPAISKIMKLRTCTISSYSPSLVNVVAFVVINFQMSLGPTTSIHSSNH